MKRAAFHFVLSVLLMATLVWGECLSCPRLFSTRQSKSCCKPTGCEQKPKPAEPRHEDCKTHPESALTFVKADLDWAQPADQGSGSELADPNQLTTKVMPPLQGPAFTRAADYSPPERYLFFSVFRI